MRVWRILGKSVADLKKVEKISSALELHRQVEKISSASARLMAIGKRATMLRWSKSLYYKLKSNTTEDSSEAEHELLLAKKTTATKSKSKLDAGASRRRRWVKRMVLRRRKLLIRVARIKLSWLSPTELFHRVRKAYIRAVLREDSNSTGLVVTGHWSLPVMLPFYVAP